MHRKISQAVLLTAIGMLAGCSENDVALVPVEGRVTLDSQPLADALVVFYPESGRPSAGRTDADGRYILRYTDREVGALPGRHKVSISTFQEPDADSSDPVRQSGKPEQLPPQYNSQSNLTAEVTSDLDSPLDFELSSSANRPR